MPDSMKPFCGLCGIYAVAIINLNLNYFVHYFVCVRCCFLAVSHSPSTRFLCSLSILLRSIQLLLLPASYKMYLNFKYGIVCECLRELKNIHIPYNIIYTHTDTHSTSTETETENWKHQQHKKVTKMPMAIIWKLHTHSKVHYECAKHKRNAAGLAGWAHRAHTHTHTPCRCVCMCECVCILLYIENIRNERTSQHSKRMR